MTGVAAGSDVSLSPQVLEAYLTARSTARGVPLPVHDRGGLRVDTGSAEELCRYVFLRADEAFRAAAETITTPRILLKTLETPDTVRAIVPARWTVQSVAWVMTQTPRREDAETDIPADYALTLTTRDGVTAAVISTRDGGLAASGYACSARGVYCYDRIVTQPTHLRRGLGGAIMRALGRAQPDAGALRMLIATDAGRALYETLGWRVVAPYTTVEIVGD